MSLNTLDRFQRKSFQRYLKKKIKKKQLSDYELKDNCLTLIFKGYKRIQHSDIWFNSEDKTLVSDVLDRVEEKINQWKYILDIKE